MANRPHVPKFGDWNNQDQPFTVVFDNARTNKRADLYESLENPETRTPAKAPPQPAPRNPRAEPPKPVRDEPPRALPPTERNKVKAPPADQLYGAGGRAGGRDGGGGLYGGYGGGGGSGNQRQPQAPPRPVQPKPNLRGGSNGRGGTTIPPFPGSMGSGDQNMSYTHIFDQVKEERRGSYGGTAGNTPSRPINGQHDSPAPSSSKVQ
ncbi:unnamed protein product [Thlaspi arvense]|uniref:RIN4 pathogenic type III effector avirulence factor Avr cleavage site domain-containing protein n=1 Tax=Thlaspi arvense TaxID=13288 RepID=A0AAU9S0I6_THLAR|nr:unnamed protein product [Thlaspi arvense]